MHLSLAYYEGLHRDTSILQDAILSVVPCSMSDHLSLEWCVSWYIPGRFQIADFGSRLSDAFKDLEDPPEIILAITTEDSSIVYYKISPGIVKPPL